MITVGDALLSILRIWQTSHPEYHKHAVRFNITNILYGLIQTSHPEYHKHTVRFNITNILYGLIQTSHPEYHKHTVRFNPNITP